jgi:signal transduction histidine kinase
LARIGTLAAGLAHEIKNPLVTLKTFAQLLPRRHDDPDFRDHFAPLVGSEVQRIDRIVNQLLQLSRPVAPDRRLLHLHALLDRSLQVARRRIEGRPIRIEARWGAARDEILGDADLLVQTFEHFYTNSIEAMPEGTILVTTENMKASWDESDLYGRRPSRSVIRVTVLDTGPGIPKEDRARIFDPFFTRKASGTGLGLAVARRNILAHGGTVQVADRAGYGAVFFVDLPLAPEATP